MKQWLFILILSLGISKFYTQTNPALQGNEKNEVDFDPALKKNINSKQIKIYTESYWQSNQKNDIHGQISALLNLAKLNFECHQNYNNVLAYIKEIEQLADKDDYLVLSESQAIKSSILIKLGLQKKAKKYIDEEGILSNKILDEDDKRFAKTLYYGSLSLFYKSQNKQNSVIYFSKKQMAEAKWMSDINPTKYSKIIEAANILSTTSIELKDYKSAAYYLKIQEKYIENTSDIKNLSLYYLNKAIFETETTKDIHAAFQDLKKAENLALKIEDEYLLNLIYPKIANVYKSKNDSKSQITYLRKSEKIKEIITENEWKTLQALTLDVNEKNENAFKKYTLFTSLALIFFAISFFLLKDKVKIQPGGDNSLPDSETNTDEKNFYIEDLYQLALQDDASFYPNYIKKFPHFESQFLQINPSMKTSDIEFCAFMKLGLTDKQIAESKKLTLKAVIAKKYRIRKKLNLSLDIDIASWISKFIN